MSKKAGMRKFAINCSIAVHPRPLPSINIVIYPFHTVFVVCYCSLKLNENEFWTN